MAKGFGGMNNMQGILKQAQAMQEKMARMQEEAESKTVEVAVGGGMVKVVANGKNRIISLKIAPEIIDPEDPEMLQDLVISAVNEAQEKVQQMVQDEMSKITGGMKIPGFM
ncbi:YbaB/EbfC family nucleoid-associated protein [Chrysiogenes arsenatis]|uniref:YbaB/EbfC family nucleoid-associated protein n=1 Tax=Chrysiogenes arsenatis TaxID=309797 RepID=UPI00040D8BC3|nr:YbaB/EbfC family nucleoid-associated protein [Chrysiogenes arsenatis]